MHPCFGVLIVSRNNYEMQQLWHSKWVFPKGTIVLNIDEGSTDENRTFGIEVCKRLGISFLDSDLPGMHFNLVQAFRFFMERDVSWILYSQHDAYPLGSKTLDTLNQNIRSGKYNGFGIIGFNVHDGEKEVQDFCESRIEYKTTARSVLQLGDGWYRRKSGSRILYPHKFGELFSVESVHWSNALISSDSFFNKIIPDPFYRFFHAWDDLAFQFLLQETPNVVDSTLPFAHDQSLKTLVGLPPQSPHSKSEAERFVHYNTWGHLEHWKQKWGFEWNVDKNILLRHPRVKTLEKSIRTKFLWNLYLESTSGLETQTRYDIRMQLNNNLPSLLMTEFYNHDPRNGFLKTFD